MDDQYRERAKLWIERFYHCDTTEEQDLILSDISEEDLEVLRWILLDTNLYSTLYNKEFPGLAPPPAGYKGRT